MNNRGPMAGYDSLDTWMLIRSQLIQFAALQGESVQGVLSRSLEQKGIIILVKKSPFLRLGTLRCISAHRNIQIMRFDKKSQAYTNIPR